VHGQLAAGDLKVPVGSLQPLRDGLLADAEAARHLQLVQAFTGQGDRLRAALGPALEQGRDQVEGGLGPPRGPVVVGLVTFR